MTKSFSAIRNGKKVVTKKPVTSKTTKKKTKRKTFRKKASSEKFDLDILTTMLKDNKGAQAIEKLLQNCDVETRVSFVLTELNNSSFRSFRNGLQKFNYVITTYLKNKDKQILTDYVAQTLDTADQAEASYRLFTELRTNLIYTLLEPDDHKKHCYYSLLILEQVRNKNYDEDFTNKYFTSLCANLAERVWPEKAKGLKVLYGQS
jgi:hypothetical protein